MRSSGQPGTLDSSPEVAATARLLHRRDAWGLVALTSLLGYIFADGVTANAQSEGAPTPFWFQVIVYVLAALTVVAVIAIAADSVLLRRKPADVRAQAVPLAARHPSRPRLHHYPPRHQLPWALRWVGMLLILSMAVVTVPAVVDGVAYLAGAEKTATFDPVSYQTNCDQYSCQTSTEGVLLSGGQGVQAAWPDVVPLGKSFQVRKPLWGWGLGGAMIDGDGTAIGAILISLLIEGAAVVVVVYLVRLARNWRRHRRQRQRAASVAVT
jgi:hypothetical protein